MERFNLFKIFLVFLLILSQVPNPKNSLSAQSEDKGAIVERELNSKLKSASDPNQITHLYIDLAKFHFDQKLYDKAHLYGDSALLYIDLIASEKDQFSAVLNLLYSSYPNIDQAYKKAIDLFQQQAQKDMLLIALASHHAEFSSLIISNNFVDSLSRLLPKLKEDHEQAIVHYCLSLFYDYSEMLPKLIHLNKAESLVDSTLESSIDLLVDLGVLYDELEIPDRSLELGLKAYRIAENFDDPQLKIRPLFRIVSVAAAIDDHALVEQYAAYGINLFNDLGIKGSLGWMYGLRGFSRLKNDNIDRAFSDFHLGIEISEKYNSNSDLSRCLEGMALAYFKEDRIKEARFFALKAQTGDSMFCEHCEELADIFEQAGDYKMASIYKDKTISSFSKRERAYNKYQIASELLNENFEKEKSALEQSLEFRRRANFQNVLLTAAAALMGFLIFLFFYQRRRNKIRNLMLQTQVAKQTEEISLQKRQLEELDKVKTKLYTNITHEFRTPLTVISGIAQNMKSRENEKERNLILRNSDQLLNLVNQMLDLRKLESGAMEVQMSQHDVVQYIRYLTESFKSLSEGKGVQIHFLPQKENIWMDVDVEKLTRIHTNLLRNAIKFTPNGGHIYIQLSVEDEFDRTFIYQMKDTGIGIQQTEIEHIFDRFYQVDDSTTREGEGTGIGLTLVREMVQLLKGQIDVQSTVGRGTTFTIKLPISQLAPKSEEVEYSAHIQGLSTLDIKDESNEVVEDDIDGQPNKPIVLVIEDNIDVIYYITECLRSEFHVLIALNGEEGIEKALEQTPDIVLSDVMMPIKDGLEVCQTLKSDHRTSHIPIVLLTAKADIASRMEGLEQGADAYLAKPFHKQELLIIMHNQIKLRRDLHKYFGLQVVMQKGLSKDSSLLMKVPELNVEIEGAFLQSIRGLVEKDLSDSDFGMLQLMRGLGMSRSQIYKKVKALTGDSPSIYIRKIRLKHAKQKLKEGSLNVSEVAYAVGFDSPAYFSDVFLEEYGHRPSEMR